MDVATIALARLVPFLFLLSLALVGTRYVFDLFAPRNRRLAAWLSALVALLGLAAAGPTAIRGFFRTAAQYDIRKAHWEEADADFAQYDSWHGQMSRKILTHWAYVRMQMGRYAGARMVLERITPKTPSILLELGVCAYFAHDADAEAILRAVPDDPAAQLAVRDYLRGRIEQKRGHLTTAFAWYANASRQTASFFPSTYHAVRIALLGHRPDIASRSVASFMAATPYLAHSPDVVELQQAIAGRRILLDKEFFIVI